MLQSEVEEKHSLAVQLGDSALVLGRGEEANVCKLAHCHHTHAHTNHMSKKTGLETHIVMHAIQNKNILNSGLTFLHTHTHTHACIHTHTHTHTLISHTCLPIPLPQLHNIYIYHTNVPQVTNHCLRLNTKAALVCDQ